MTTFARGSVILLALLLAGCGAAPRNIGFGAEASLAFRAVQPNVQRVYFDRWGSIYPPIRYPDSCAELSIVNLSGSRATTDGGPGLLSDLFSLFRAAETSDYLAVTKQPWYCPTGAEWNELLKTLGAAESANWKVIQDKLRDRIAKDLTKYDRVIVLIHGYRSLPHEVENQFEMLRQKTQQALGNDDARKSTAFLYVFWDGIQGRRIGGSWGRAQFNAPLVGLGLRRLLHQITQTASGLRSVEIVGISHSLGAAVLSAAFWDARGSLNRGSPSFQFFDLEEMNGKNGNPLPKAKSIRVGMLAPAIPSSALEYFSRTDRENGGKLPSRVVVGFNPSDYALSKYVPAFPGIGCSSLFGSTCLGVSRRDLEQARAHVPESVSSFHVIENWRTPTYKLPWTTSHAMEDYVDSDAMTPFLRLLLEVENSQP